MQLLKSHNWSPSIKGWRREGEGSWTEVLDLLSSSYLKWISWLQLKFKILAILETLFSFYVRMANFLPIQFSSSLNGALFSLSVVLSRNARIRFRLKLTRFRFRLKLTRFRFRLKLTRFGQFWSCIWWLVLIVGWAWPSEICLLRYWSVFVTPGRIWQHWDHLVTHSVRRVTNPG